MAFLTPEKKILIVGMGLIGGSYADALSAAGFELGGIDRSRSAIDTALRRGIIRHGETSVRPEYVAAFDLIVFALYPHDFEAWIREYGGCIRPRALVTDVTGVKGTMVGRIQDLLGPGVEFVAAHPMAGRELSGVENSDRRIFRDANFIITPTERNSREGIAALRELAGLLGFAKVSVLSPAEHDEMIAFLSQLAHCMAVALMDCRECTHFAAYTGDSFRDLTRIARINENMWTELFLANRKALLSQMDLFAEKFMELRDALDRSDAEKLKDMMRLSTRRRSSFDKD